MGDEAQNPAGSQTNRTGSGGNNIGQPPLLSNTTFVHQQQSDSQPSQEQQMPSGSYTANSLDMSNMAASLHEYGYRQVHHNMYQQPYLQSPQHSPLVFPYPNSQYSGSMHSNYTVPFMPQMHPQGFTPPRTYGQYPVGPNMGVAQQMFPGQAYYQQQSPISPSLPNSFNSSPQGQSFVHAQNQIYGVRGPGQYPMAQLPIDGYANTAAASPMYAQHELQGLRRTSSSNSLKVPSALRGPPRKPKQSGHALWVGNLPPGTNILDLKDHFSRNATGDIESVFLISKSNCAFVNYKTEQSCVDAMGRFHDSRFNGVRLVCRLRRGSSPAITTVSASTSAGTPIELKHESIPALATTASEKVDEPGNSLQDSKTKTKVKERYFIIKSLTIDDLHRSAQSGIWATQSHNEDALNEAFQTAEDVYLIFSANKSGEYFGYARMDSSIDSEPAADIDPVSPEIQKEKLPPPAQLLTELPRTIPTPATETAPKGYIIDDSARGTIFWEAEVTISQLETGVSGASPADTDSGDVSGDDTTDIQPSSSADVLSTTNTTFGKPFRITWISTDRLPFYRTRGLRNPWNTNREVKIARDGTELEPGIGRKLISMFNTNTIPRMLQQQNQYTSTTMSMPSQGSGYRAY